MMGVFTRSWDITKISFKVIKADKELIAFPILAGVFSILFAILMFFPTVISVFMAGGRPDSTIFFIILFISYLGLSFIATFFNVCVVYTSSIRFTGKNATFMDSIRFALTRTKNIFYWSLVSAIVGLLLQLIQSVARRAGGIGRIVISIFAFLGSLAWSIASVFVLPVIVYDDLTPFKAIKKSVQVLKNTWGESLFRFYGLGIARGIVLGIGLLIFFGLWKFLIFGQSLFITLFVLSLAVLYAILVIIVFSIANSIFNTALYVYGTTGKVPIGFDEELLKEAFVSSTRVGNKQF